MPVSEREITIRRAEITDAAEVSALLVELGYPENDPETVRRRLAAWSAERHCEALVADVDGHVAGVVAVAAIPYLEREGRWGRIVALVVAEAHRGNGIGRRLMEAAEAVAREHGCVTVELSSAVRRADAHAFYERLGYEDAGGQARLFRRAL
jgi:GNAT superfamily N-acetyltransferase